MIFRRAIRVMFVLAATVAWAQQSGLPGTTPSAPMLSPQSLAARRGPVGNKPVDPQGLIAMRQRVQDMENTISQMRVALKQMHAKAAKSKPIDSVTKANLDMWDLMVGHLDKELEQLRATLAAREDMESRRAALYKQADAKAEAEAQAARAASAARFADAAKNATGTPTPKAAAEQKTGQSAQQSVAPQTVPAQPSASPSTNNSASPN